MSRATVWTERLLDSPYGLLWLGVLSAAETTVLPIPIELIMVPYMLARPQRLWLITAVTLAGCIAGSLIGYAVGFFLFDTVGQTLLGWLNAQDAYEGFEQTFSDNGFVAILTIGVTPVPFQVALLAAGMAGYSLPLFLVAVALARGLRYFGLALLVWLFGERALKLWRRHALATGMAAFIVIAAIFIAIRLLGGQ
mgnify:CR=1 FL=1